MRKLLFSFLCVTSLCFILCSCHHSRWRTNSTLNLAQQIHVSCQYRQKTIIRTYSDPQKMEIILRFVHRLSPMGLYHQPIPQHSGDSCQITVHMVDGTTRNYHLQGKELLQKDGGRWHCVDPENANVIYHLLHALAHGLVFGGYSI